MTDPSYTLKATTKGSKKAGAAATRSLSHFAVIGENNELRLELHMQPRFVRMSEAPAYLGMCRAEFNKSVRPFVREFPVGKQGIGFDRHELDEWADGYIESHAVQKDIPDDKPKCKERKEWRKGSKDSNYKMASGTSISGSRESDFAKALAQAKGQRPSAT